LPSTQIGKASFMRQHLLYVLHNVERVLKGIEMKLESILHPVTFM